MFFKNIALDRCAASIYELHRIDLLGRLAAFPE
jgi:hypothetical protein